MADAKNSPCNGIQESIAWGRSLSEVEQKHVLDCPGCGRVVEDFLALESMMDGRMEIQVPPDFADTIMRRIENERYSPGLREKKSGWRLIGMDQFSALRMSFAYFGAVLFVVFGVLVPVAG